MKICRRMRPIFRRTRPRWRSQTGRLITAARQKKRKTKLQANRNTPTRRRYGCAISATERDKAARSRSSFRWKMQTMGKRRTLRSRARRCTIPDRSRGTSLYRKRKNTRATALKRRKKRNFPTGHGGRSSAKESSSAAPCWFWPGQDMPFGSRCQSGSAA